ncbi:hypothetical protein FHS18_004930 [Paenibacillus phyllosphaerae]|uniref:Uncharacterized protein n=1 Tax=Paenibacillus phyllosphaerae TaxID=274593 RepID=A0A7W5FQ18_9BACL|nr:hypothetical protein [Paenibacillus phyllosphaerae]MBB3112828.1 hypothetical protein [Paenibacillus phyllosphaerae]
MREGKHGHRGHHGHHGHGEGRGRGEHHRIKSAQTFRRGRAIHFLEKLHLKRATLLQQLNQPEFDSIKQVISGELKAVDTIIQEFIHTFELHEMPAESDDASDTPSEAGDTKPTEGEEEQDERH